MKDRPTQTDEWTWSYFITTMQKAEGSVKKNSEVRENSEHVREIRPKCRKGDTEGRSTWDVKNIRKQEMGGTSVERWRIALRRSARVQNKKKRRHKRKGGSAFSTEYLTFPWRRTRPRKQGTWEEWPGSDGRRWPGARGLSCWVEWDGDFERHQPGHFILKLQKTREKCFQRKNSSHI